MTTPAEPTLHGEAVRVLSGGRFQAVASGRRSMVWRVEFDDGRPTLALKQATPAGFDGATVESHREAVSLIQEESARLVWVDATLHGRGVATPAPVVLPDADDPDPLLVTAWLEGTTDPRLMRSPEVAVENFARATASLHAASRRVDLSTCGFDASLGARIDAAARRVEAGLVDTSTLEDPFNRYTPRELLDRVRQMASACAEPGDDDRVFVHGDLCVSNIIFDPAYSTTVGAVDWAFAGVGDRHQDLAITARSLSRNLSGEVLPDFFAAYGLAEPDLMRIETWVLLEELF